MKSKTINIILLSLVFSFSVGIIDSTLFLAGEESISSKISDAFNIDAVSSNILTSAISGAVAIFLASYIKQYLDTHYTINENPFIDGFGVLLGGIFIIILYNIFKIIKN